MFVILNILTAFFLLNKGQAQRASPFPHLIDFKDSDVGKPVFTFDGVDYSLLPKDIYERDFKFNCYEEYARCSRFLVYSSPVCGYHTYHKIIWGFYNICELDLASCKDMKSRNVHAHGTNYRNRGVYFLGEGNTCELYLRRIAEGLVPRDIRDAPDDESTPDITINVATRATHLQHDKTMPNTLPNTEYDYDNIIY